MTENGGEVRLGKSVAARRDREPRRSRASTVARQPRILPNDYEDELIEADCVISTLPVWHVLRVVPEWELPDWYVGQIKHLAQDHFRIAWLGLYLAVDEPVRDPRPARALDLAPHADRARPRLLLRADRARPVDRAGGQVPLRHRRDHPRRRRATTSASCVDDVREVRGRHRRRCTPGLAKPDLAAPAPGLRAVVRRDPEAGPRRHRTGRTCGPRTSTGL